MKGFLHPLTITAIARSSFDAEPPTVEHSGLRGVAPWDPDQDKRLQKMDEC